MNKQSKIFIGVVVVIIIVTGIVAVKKSKQTGSVAYLDHLDDTIFTLDGIEYPLRDLAVYIASSEANVEEQAISYNSEDTSKYWNTHVNGKFVKLTAKENVIQTAIHDRLFYNLSEDEKLNLDENETEYLKGKKTDFWEDLTEEQQKQIGVGQEEIDIVFDKMALAQKQQVFLSESNGLDYEEYNVDGDAYQDLLREHTYTINENLWEQIDFGNITLHH